MRNPHIYVLIDPLTYKIRYVGKTIKKDYDCLDRHIQQAKRCSDYRANWIKKILRNKSRPLLLFIQESNEENWQQDEIYWIKTLRNAGFKLTNISDGGFGGMRCNWTEQKKKKQSEKLSLAMKKYWRKKGKRSSKKVICVICEDKTYITYPICKKCLEVYGKRAENQPEWVRFLAGSEARKRRNHKKLLEKEICFSDMDWQSCLDVSEEYFEDSILCSQAHSFCLNSEKPDNNRDGIVISTRFFPHWFYLPHSLLTR